MQVVTARLPENSGSIVDFVVKRTPAYDRTLLRSELHNQTARSLRAFLTFDDDDTLAGVSFARCASNLPEGAALVMVSTRDDLAAQGHGSALWATTLAGMERDVHQLVTCVDADDPRSLSVARHWGFQHVQLSVTSSVVVADCEAPKLATGLSVEACDDLTFDDEGAVDAMLLASQTNPEFDLGLAVTLQGLRETPAPGQRPVAVLTRVKQRPAAISFAVSDGDQMHVVYTGVEPERRGQGIGRVTKQALHAHASDLGIRVALADNEEGNVAIRRVNESLGYTLHRSWSWMMRPRS